MTVLGANKSTNAGADGFAASRARKTECNSTSAMSQSARTRTSRPSGVSFLAAPTIIETSPEMVAANAISLKMATKRPLTAAKVAFPMLMNDHERQSPDGATQGPSV